MALPENPITRKEAYLAKIAGQEVQIPDVPITREEAYLNQIAREGTGTKVIANPDDVAEDVLNKVEIDGEVYSLPSGGGGGGSDDYLDLDNLPQVNGVELRGNKTTSDLGIKFEDLPDAPTIPTNLADLDGDSTHRTVTDTEKATWNGKSDFSGNYSDLNGLPTLGTASAKNVPASGDASSNQVVMGNDSRLSDSRPASDVSAWAKQATKPTYTASEVGAIPSTDKGANGGVAELDSNGKVPSSQLPSYVDDVLSYSSQSAFPATGETGKIYIAEDTNKTYRWSGSAYAEISASLALGETSSTAYRGDRGKTAYDHSQTTGNPHGTTAADVGLGNVPNVSTNNQTPTFTEASTRNNIASGEKLSVILGKVQKFFNDLKTVAFSGSYTDLTNQPQINGNTLTGNKTTGDLGINADNVMMSDGVTSVEDVLDIINGEQIQVTLPFTPPENGILLCVLIANTEGEVYGTYTGTTPNVVDGYNKANGYYSAILFVKKSVQVSKKGGDNIKSERYYFKAL